MDLELKDKVVLVTGGAQGIGEAITRRFAKEGAVTIILDRNEKAATALVQSLKAESLRVDWPHVDLTSLPQIATAIGEVLQKHGRLDVLVNNAGVNDSVGLSHSPDDFLQSIHKNLIHCFACVHYALDALKKSRGCIVNIGSKVCLTGQGGTSGYAASKGAVAALTREWAVDLAQDGIRVNCVLPAEVMTTLYEQWISKQPNPELALKNIEKLIPLGGRFTSVEEIADTVAFVASARSSHTTGQLLHVDGGYTHLDRAQTFKSDH